MRFIDQAKANKSNVGTYLLTIVIVFSSIVIGQLISEAICLSVLGHSLLEIPAEGDFNLILSLLLFPFALAFGTLLLAVRYIHKQAVKTLFTAREQFDWKRFAMGFLTWGVVMAIFLLGSISLGAPIEWNFDPSTFFLLILISIFILPIQTSMEEVLFRGFMLQGFARFGVSAWLPILLSGLLFGFLHGSNPEVAILGYGVLIYYVVTGLFLGLIAHFDDGLEIGLGYHAINNIFAALIVTNNWQAFHTDALLIDKSAPVFGWESLLTIFLLQPLLLFVFSKIYRWENWRDKLFK